MKIALVLERFNLTRGGAERSTYEMACSLTALGIDVTIVAGQIDRNGIDNDQLSLVEVHKKHGIQSLQWKRFEKAVAAHVGQNNYDVVHSMVPLQMADVYQPRGGSMVKSSARHSQSFNSPVKVWLKQKTAWMNRGRQAKIASERELCNRQDGPVLAALSSYVAGQFKDDYQLDAKRIRLIRNGVRTDVLRGEQAIKQGRKLRSLYDRDDNLALFVFAAENFRLKGLDWLLQSSRVAAEQLKEKHRDFRILVAGSDDYTQYWQKAQDLGLAGRVLFLGSTNQMPALLQMADAVVLPTYNDACSRIILEALAAGKPGITTKFNGAADFLQEGKYGVIIDNCDDTQALTNALLKICDKSEQVKMAKAIEFDKVYEQVSMTRHAAELIKLYEEIVVMKIT